MNEFLRLVVVFVAAINPAAVALAMAMPAKSTRSVKSAMARRWQVPAIGAGLAAVLYAAAVFGAEPLLDWLQIEPESFRVAAGVVMATVGVYTVWSGRLGDYAQGAGAQAGLFPLGLPLLAGPAGLIAALSYSVDKGAGKTAGAICVGVIVAVAVVTLRPAKAGPALDGVARVTGALLVAVAAGLIVSGVRAI